MTDISYEGIEKYFNIVNISASNIYGVAKKSGARAIQPELKDELESSGMVALLEAWNKFDPEHKDTFQGKKTSFKTFAFYRVRGAMLDHLRNEDTVSRSVRAKIKKLVTDLDNNVSSLELSQEEINKTLKQSVALFQFLSSTDSEDQEISMDFADESNYQCDIDTQETVSKLLKLCPLTPKENTVIKEHYFNNKNFLLIGQQLGITESRISQIHKAALKKLETYV